MSGCTVGVSDQIDHPRLATKRQPFDRVGHAVRSAPWVLTFLIPAMAQLRFGVDDVGLVEEWGVYYRFDEAGAIFWTPDDAVLKAQAIRPLTVAPHALAYTLDPNSFAWFHVLQALALGLKGVAMFGLLRTLRLRPAVAFVAAMVFALYPAWDSHFTFRTIHIQAAIGLFVLALWLFVRFNRSPSWPTGIGMACATGASLLFYEVAYVGIALAPLLLLLDRRSWRRTLRTASIWYIAPLINGIRIILLLTSGQSLYQEAINVTVQRHPSTEAQDLADRVITNGLSSFWHPPFGMSVGAFGVVSLLLCLCVCALLPVFGPSTLDHAPSSRTGPSWRWRMAALAGFGVIAAPIMALVYYPQPAHLIDPLRIFSIGSVGLGFGVAGLLELLATTRSRIPARLFGAALLTSTLLAAEAQRTEWNHFSVLQEHSLGAIVSVLPPQSGPDQTIVVVDPALLLGTGIYNFIPDYLSIALDLQLPGVQSVVLCHTPLDLLPASAPALPEQCTLSDGVLTSPRGSTPLADAVVVEIRPTADGAGWSGEPVMLDNDRERGMIGCVAQGSCDDGAFGIQARLISSPTRP